MKEISISQVDALFAGGLYPIEFLFYYKEPFDTRRLQKALHRLSAVFWPAFGTYADGAIRASCYRGEEYYHEEQVDLALDLLDGEARAAEAVSRFRAADPGRLFHLQVLRLKNGLALIPRLSHLAGDGYSYFYFLSLLATLSRTERVPFKRSLTVLSFKPHHRRTALGEFSFRGRTPAAIPPQGEPRIVTDEILRKDVAAVNREAAEGGEAKISSNDVLTAAAVKTMAGRPNAFPEDTIEVTIPIDVRSKVKEYGRKFFGNGIWLRTFALHRRDIESLSLKDLAVRVRKAMPLVSSETYREYLAGLKRTIDRGETGLLRPFAPERGCLVTNLSRMPSDKLDFGSGPPDLVVPLTSERNSAGILAKKDGFLLKYGY